MLRSGTTLVEQIISSHPMVTGAGELPLISQFGSSLAVGHLGLEWDDACLSPQDNNRSVATASNVQVWQRVYQGSSERWKRYKPYLNGGLDRLGFDHQ